MCWPFNLLKEEIMITLKYEDFIKGINRDTGNIKQINFYIEGYPHYHDCSIGRYIKKVRVHERIVTLTGRITCILTKDHSEDVSFYRAFKEDRKIFDFGRKGRYTLKDVWDKVVITNISYFVND